MLHLVSCTQIGGNAKTLMIACLSPSFFSETEQTMKFASRCVVSCLLQVLRRTSHVAFCLRTRNVENGPAKANLAAKRGVEEL